MKPLLLLLGLLLALLLAATAVVTAQTIPVDTFPLSSVVTPDGKTLLVLSSGPSPGVSVIDIATAKELSRAKVPDGWLGLAITKAGDKVYVGGGSKAAIYEFTFANRTLTPSRMFPIVAEKDRKPQDFIGDVQLSPDGRLLYAADLFHDSLVVVNPQSGMAISRIKTGRRPYRILFHKSGKSLYVSSWADGTVGQYDPATGQRMAVTPAGPHATEMVWREGGVEDQPAIKARLFVSASNTNNVYVLGATETGTLSRLETISLAMHAGQPAGMTPEGMGLSADGKLLYVACADANVAALVDLSEPRSRVMGFVPTGAYPTAALGLPDGRVAVLNGRAGSVQILETPDAAKLIATSPFGGEQAPPPASPIKHVIYVVTGGQDLSKLAGQALLLDNFHADGLGSTIAGITTDFQQKLGRRLPGDYQDREPANTPPAGYLWSNAAQAGISIGNYGFFVENLKAGAADGTQISGVHDPVLAKATDDTFRGPDPDYPDTSRAKAFLTDLAEFGKANSMPQLLFLRLAGADSDQAIGIVAEALSKTRFANETAIFVVPAETEKGQALVISAGVKAGTADHSAYTQASVLRTIELILGLHPMTAADATAPPVAGVS